MNETERQEWNRAVESGNEAEIKRLQDYHLTDLAMKQLADWDVTARTGGATRP